MSDKNEAVQEEELEENLSETATMLLAVYGTLKEDFPNYIYYLNPRRPIFQGLVQIPFQMYSNGGFPLLFPADEPHPIYIEVFEVDEKTIDKIDRFEGVPRLYTREQVLIEEINEEVFLYVVTNREPIGDLIVDGFFPKREE